MACVLVCDPLQVSQLSQSNIKVGGLSLSKSLNSFLVGHCAYGIDRQGLNADRLYDTSAGNDVA
jgi:hypothetical protein